MLPAERKQKILAILKENGEASVKGLGEILGVATSSIRRDLRELEEENRILRRHGRAIYRSPLVTIPIQELDELEPGRMDELVDEMVSVLHDARNLFFTGGPVLAVVASRLSGKTIVTHDLAIGMAAAAGGNDVSLVGREIDNESLTLRSSNFAGELEQHYFDAAVVETDGIDERNLWVARKNHSVLPALLERADSLIAVGTSHTIGRKGDRVAAPLKRAALVVVDKGVEEHTRKALSKHAAELRIAGEGEGYVYAHDQVGNVSLFKRTENRFQSDDSPDQGADGHDLSGEQS